MKKYTDSLAAHQRDIEKKLIDIVVFSNGSITLEDLYNSTFKSIELIWKSIEKKIKIEKNIKGQEML